MNRVASALIDSRRPQMFPVLSESDIARMTRFGQARSYHDGDVLVRAGEIGPGLFVVLSGQIRITQRDGLGHISVIVDHGPGEFLGEVGQLSERASLVDAHAVGDVETILIPPERLRALLIVEAELGERIMRALILRRVGLIETGGGGPVLVGPSSSADLVRLAGFLARNGFPYQSLDPAIDKDAADLVAQYNPGPDELPLVVCVDGRVLRNPDVTELAQCLGMVREAECGRTYDVAIIGAGPAGLATAVYAASEGLSVIVVDSRAFGGQAGASARIENYFGFPTGISGQALAGRAFVQAQKFGAEIAIPATVAKLECPKAGSLGDHRVELVSSKKITARAVVVASGARYRRLAVENVSDFEGRGVWYWASPIEARMCAREEIVLVGGGNSAGQAAVFLSGHASRVIMMVRAKGLADTMSRYLIDRIEARSNVELKTETEIVALAGSHAGLERVRWRHRPTGTEEERPIRNVFLFIGADPASDWLAECGVALDAKGFVETGGVGKNGRTPLPLESSRAGVFAVGDVRSGSVKRVGGAIGEGAAVVAQIHDYLGARQHAHATSS